MFRVGDTVTVGESRFPGMWTVDKVCSVNLKLVQGGSRLTAHPSLCTAWADSDTAETLELPTYFDVGAVVRCSGRDARLPRVAVVLKDDGGDRVRVAKLGGDAGRYWRMARHSVEAIDLDQLAHILALTDEAL